MTPAERATVHQIAQLVVFAQMTEDGKARELALAKVAKLLIGLLRNEGKVKDDNN